MKIGLLILGGLLVLVLLNVIGQGRNTLDRLTFVERERDQWQRAPEIIRQLELHRGSRVADLGCGAGYFALKLSAAVGPTGSVQAVDILRLPLLFLWLRSSGNVHEIRGEPDDPHISGSVDAVLVANTYHELTDPKLILERLRAALISGGRIVIADRGPGSGNPEHAIDPALVVAELQQSGFEILSREDHFLVQPDEGPWWLIVARKASL